MFYILQKGLRSGNEEVLIKALDEMGLGYEECRMIPFVGEIEFTTKRKDVFCFGSISLASAAHKYGWRCGSMHNANHDFEVYGKEYEDKMLNHGALIMEFTDAIPESFPEMFFARPTKDVKIFSGQVFMKHSWDEYVADCIKNEATYHITSETKVMLAPLKNIEYEVRCWIVGRKVITMSQYKKGNRIIYKNVDDLDWLREIVQEYVYMYEPAEAFVMDVCKVEGEDEIKIVEINCINSSGLYHANCKLLIEAIENHFNKKVYWDDKQKLNFHKDLLISLHTYGWTGNKEKFGKLLSIIGGYSYKHTNSNAGEEYEPERYFDELVVAVEKLHAEPNSFAL